jgi:hypothetical protein
MATEHDYDDDELDTQERQPDIRSLRQRAEQAGQYEQEIAQLRRENLFAKAGIDTDSKIGRMLFKTFEGTSLDELRTEAEDLGLFTPGRNSIPTDEQDQAAFRRGLSGGQSVTAPDDQGVDPFDDAYSNFYEDRKRGAALEDSQLAAIDRILVAASNGDQRVIFDQNVWDRNARRPVI